MTSSISLLGLINILLRSHWVKYKNTILTTYDLHDKKGDCIAKILDGSHIDGTYRVECRDENGTLQTKDIESLRAAKKFGRWNARMPL